MAAILKRLGLNGRQQRALFGVRAKLTLRQFTREPGKIIGLIIGLLFFVPFVLGLSAATGAGYLFLPQPWPAQLLGGVLTFLWLFWIAYPILFSSLNEGIDPSRLLLYPLRGRDLATAVLTGTLLDYTTYIMLPLFVAIIVGFWGWQVPIVLLGLLLAYAHMVIASQLIIAIFGSLFQSRRFRDVIIILSSFIGIGCYLSQYALQNVDQINPDQLNPELLAQLRPLTYLQWLPTGAVARAIEQSMANNWLATLAWLAYSAVFLLCITYLWLQLLRRLNTGQGFLLQLSAKPAPQATPKARPAQPRNNQAGWLPADLREIMLKEGRQIWRTPQRRIGLLWSAVMPLIFFGPFLAQGGFADGVPHWASLALPAYAMFTFWVAGQNMLGYEGSGIATLLLTPIARRRYFWGKSIPLALMGLPVYLLVSVGIGLMQPTWLTLSSFVTGLAVLPAAFAVSCTASVLFPFPVKLEVTGGGGGLNNGRYGGGCVTGLANAIVVPLFMAAVNLPLILGLGLAFWFDWSWYVYLLPLTLLYGAVVFFLGTTLAARMMLQREPEIIAALRHDESGK